MAETSPKPYTERLSQADARAAEQLESVRSMVEFDGEVTKLDATYFTPKDSRYAAFLDNERPIVSAAEDADDLESIKHYADNPFIFDEFNIKHKSLHQAELELRDTKSKRAATLTVGKTATRGWFGTKKVEGINGLVFRAVDPEDALLNFL